MRDKQTETEIDRKRKSGGRGLLAGCHIGYPVLLSSMENVLL